MKRARQDASAAPKGDAAPPRSSWVIRGSSFGKALTDAAGRVAFWRRGPSSPGRTEPSPEALTPQALDRADPGRGRMADAPWRIPARGWKDILWRAYRKLGHDSLPSVAGGVTFYVLLATFPAITAFISVYGLFLDPTTVEDILFKLSAILPDDALDLIGAQMVRLTQQKHEVLSATLAVSTLISIWSANSGMKALLIGLNVAYSETEKRRYFERSMFCYAATLGTVLFLAIFVFLVAAAPTVWKAAGLEGIGFVWASLRWLAVYLIAATAFILIYRYGPSRRRARWRWVSFGGASAALLWMIGSLCFTFYLDNFNQLGVTYGSLGAVIGFMLWVWVSLMVLLVGAELNAEIEHQTALDTTVGPPAPMGERGAIVADTLGKAFTVSPAEARSIAKTFVRREWDKAREHLRRLSRLGPR